MKGAVLIVDDDDDVREMLRLVIEGEGYPVETAANGQEALALLADDDKPCLMLLDLMMPVMDGWETLGAMREHPGLDTVRVVICTSSPQQAPAGYPILGKPIPLDQLLDTIHRACDSPA